MSTAHFFLLIPCFMLLVFALKFFYQRDFQNILISLLLFSNALILLLAIFLRESKEGIIIIFFGQGLMFLEILILYLVVFRVQNENDQRDKLG